MNTTKTAKVVLTCESGHRFTFYPEPDGFSGLFAGPREDRVEICDRRSYAYTHGGCCYRAAVDFLIKD